MVKKEKQEFELGVAERQAHIQHLKISNLINLTALIKDATFLNSGDETIIKNKVTKLLLTL